MDLAAIINLGFYEIEEVMAESHVVSALVAKRAEIAGVIAQTERRLGQFHADLVHLDATLRPFAPELEPKCIPTKKVRQSDLWFERGELPRRVLDALRWAGEPIRAPDVVRAVMIDKDLDPTDRPRFPRVQWKVRDTLNRKSKDPCDYKVDCFTKSRMLTTEEAGRNALLGQIAWRLLAVRPPRTL